MREEERSKERVRITRVKQKARLYDYIRNSKVAVQILTNFEDRYDSNEDDNDARDYTATTKCDQWVEFVDALGRTRSCMNIPRKIKRRKERW